MSANAETGSTLPNPEVNSKSRFLGLDVKATALGTALGAFVTQFIDGHSHLDLADIVAGGAINYLGTRAAVNVLEGIPEGFDAGAEHLYGKAVEQLRIPARSVAAYSQEWYQMLSVARRDTRYLIQTVNDPRNVGPGYEFALQQEVKALARSIQVLGQAKTRFINPEVITARRTVEVQGKRERVASYLAETIGKNTQLPASFDVDRWWELPSSTKLKPGQINADNVYSAIRTELTSTQPALDLPGSTKLELTTVWPHSHARPGLAAEAEFQDFMYAAATSYRLNALEKRASVAVDSYLALAERIKSDGKGTIFADILEEDLAQVAVCYKADRAERLALFIEEKLHKRKHPLDLGKHAGEAEKFLQAVRGYSEMKQIIISGGTIEEPIGEAAGCISEATQSRTYRGAFLATTGLVIAIMIAGSGDMSNGIMATLAAASGVAALSSRRITTAIARRYFTTRSFRTTDSLPIDQLQEEIDGLFGKAGEIDQRKQHYLLERQMQRLRELGVPEEILSLPAFTSSISPFSEIAWHYYAQAGNIATSLNRLMGDIAQSARSGTDSGEDDESSIWKSQQETIAQQARILADPMLFVYQRYLELDEKEKRRRELLTRLANRHSEAPTTTTEMFDNDQLLLNLVYQIGTITDPAQFIAGIENLRTNFPQLPYPSELVELFLVKSDLAAALRSSLNPDGKTYNMAVLRANLRKRMTYVLQDGSTFELEITPMQILRNSFAIPKEMADFRRQEENGMRTALSESFDVGEQRELDYLRQVFKPETIKYLQYYQSAHSIKEGLEADLRRINTQDHPQYQLFSSERNNRALNRLLDLDLGIDQVGFELAIRKGDYTQAKSILGSVEWRGYPQVLFYGAAQELMKYLDLAVEPRPQKQARLRRSKTT